MVNSDILIMTELLKLEYPNLSLRQIRDKIEEEFNRQISLERLESVLYDNEDFEKESKKMQYYELQSW